MDEGILLLRILIAVTLFAHASQKSFGWFGGLGLEQMSASFANLGLRPGRVFVIAASIAEAAAAVSLLFGFLAPLGAAVAASAMTVAGITMHLTSSQFWNAARGGEYPYFIALTSLVIAFTGAGAISVDGVISSIYPLASTVVGGGLVVGLAAAAVAVIGCVPFVALLRHNRTSSTHLPGKGA